jgi:hypothetical protein
MKKTILFVLFQTIWATGFSENLRFKEFGTPIPARADLDVRWNAPTNKMPASVWVYHLLPRKLSPEIISNLMAACSFTDKDETNYGDLLVFNSPDSSRQLRVSWPWGIIDYQTKHQVSPTNLIERVPSKRRAIKLTKAILPKLGIELSDIEKKENSSEPQFNVGFSEITFFINHKAIKNLESHNVGFRRAADGMPFFGAGGTGGDGDIEFGDHGKISRILITWRNLERDKCYPTITAEMMVKSICEGKAVQGYLPSNLGDIDWSRVKNVTIKKVSPCYYVGGDRLAPSDWLYPFAALDATVDTGHGNIDVEIDCPIIDETKP